MLFHFLCFYHVVCVWPNVTFLSLKVCTTRLPDVCNKSHSAKAAGGSTPHKVAPFHPLEHLPPGPQRKKYLRAPLLVMSKQCKRCWIWLVRLRREISDEAQSGPAVREKTQPTHEGRTARQWLWPGSACREPVPGGDPIENLRWLTGSPCEKWTRLTRVGRDEWAGVWVGVK